MELSKTSDNQQKSKDILAETLERITDAFVALDNNWCYTYMNKKAANILNVDAEQMIGKHIWTEYPEGIGQPLYKAYYKAMEEQQYIYLEEYYPPYNTWFENHIYPSPNGLTIYFKDISKKKSREEALKQSEEKYRDIVENITDILCTHDLDGKVLSVNVAAKNLLGYQMEEMLQMNIQDILLPRSKEKFGSYIAKIIKDGFFKGKMYVQTKTGESQIWEVNNSLKTMDQEKTVVRGFAQDVTERIRMEKELQKEKELSDKIINSLPGLFYLADPTPKMLRWNKAFEKISGYTEEELTSIIPITLFDKEDQPAVRQSLEKTYKEGLANVEANLLTKEGKKIPFYFTGVGIEYQEKPAVLGTGIDLSEKKDAEKKLAQSEKRFKALVENNKDVIMLLDESFKVIYRSPSATAVNGWTDDDVEIINSMENIHPDDLPRVKEIMEKVLSNPGKSFEGIYRNRHKNGQYKWLEGVITNMLQDKDVGAIVLNFSDVTIRKNAEEAIIKSNERYSSLLNNLDAGVVIHAADTSIITSNPKASELLGLSEGQMKGKLAIDPHWSFMDDNSTPLPVEKYPVYQILASKQPVKNLMVAVNRPATKDIVWLIVNGFPVFNSHGEIIEEVISFIDITSLKKIEFEKEKERKENDALINSTTDLLWSVSKEYTLIAANNAFVNGLKENGGYFIKPGDNLLSPEYFTDEYLQYWKGFYNKGLAGEKVLTEVFAPQANTSDLLWFEIKIDPIFIQDKITGIACTSRDITERKKAAVEIIKSNERYELIGNATNDALWDWDLETNNIWGNKRHQQLYGLTMLDPVPDYEQWKERIHPDDREFTINGLEKAIVSENKNFIEEYRFNTKDKGWIYVYGRTYIERNNKGKAIRLVGSMMDITESKKAAKELQQSEKYLKETQSIAKLGTYILDISTGNWRGTALLDQILGIDANFEKNFEGGQMIIHPDWRKIMDDYFTELVVGKKSRFNIEYKIIRPFDNEVRWIHGIGDLKFNENFQPVTLVATIQDITEKKQSENLLIQNNEELQIAVTKVKESEEKYRTLVEQAGDCIFEVDLEGNYLEANMSASILTGYSIEELKKMNATDIVPEDELKINPIKIEEIKKGYPVFIERIIQKKDGTLLNVEISAKLMDTGKVISILRDITQRKKAEEAIKQSEEKYRTLVEQASDAIFIADENGKFITVNSSACKLSGFTEKELLKKTIYDFAIIEDLKKNPFHFKELKEGKTMLIERVMKVKDDVVMNIEVNAKLLSDGKLLAFVRDISERKKNQQALAESENRLRTIYNTEPECIKVLGFKGELIEMNPSGLVMIEADNLEQVKGHSVIEIINKPYRKAFLALTKNVFKAIPGQLEFEITGLKGTGRWLETQAVPLKNTEGKIISLLGVTRDITARKNAEAEIIKTTEQLRQLTAHLQTIREEERKKIGREIHDELGQQLTAIKMDVVWIDKKTPEATVEIKNKIKNIIGLLDGSNQSVRRILTELRSDILVEYGLLEALKWQGRQFTANTDVPVKFVTKETDIKLKEQLATCIYRIYQESLTNIMRHAAAKKVLTSLKCVNDTIILTIEDDGKGFNTTAVNSKKAFGILGMRERILSVKGKFQLISSEGKGTKITLTLPYSS